MENDGDWVRFCAEEPLDLNNLGDDELQPLSTTPDYRKDDSNRKRRLQMNPDNASFNVPDMTDVVTEFAAHNLNDNISVGENSLEASESNATENKGKSPILGPQAEEDEKAKLSKYGKGKSKSELEVIAELEVAAQEDAELNRKGKPTVNKLMKLPLLTEALAKRHLLPEFLDHGLLKVLKSWLEPLPGGNLSDAIVRTAVLKILSDLPIGLNQHCKRQQFKRSGLGKTVMLLSGADEEATNRKLAQDLAEKVGVFSKRHMRITALAKCPCPTGFEFLHDLEEIYEHMKNLEKPNKLTRKSLQTVISDTDGRTMLKFFVKSASEKITRHIDMK